MVGLKKVWKNSFWDCLNFSIRTLGAQPSLEISTLVQFNIARNFENRCSLGSWNIYLLIFLNWYGGYWLEPCESSCPEGSEYVHCKWHIYIPAIDTLVTGMLVTTCCSATGR